ncbi:MAG: SPFH domain-containing protein [Methylococcales bacterium]|nr:SPFH domain-containing protein [Methylococcales bacterium]
MGFLDGLKRQLRSVIEWQNPAANALFEQWSDNGDEIKNASTLIVGPGQGCIFVYQGKVQEVFDNEGSYNLRTDNIPFWTTITKVMQFFESEHKVGIYFYRKTVILDQKWGTTSLIKYQDPSYKFPVGLRAFGNYSYRIHEPANFFVNVLGGQNIFTTDDLKQIIVARLSQPLTDFLATSHYGYLDIDANREEIADGVQKKLMLVFSELGFTLTDFRIEGTDFDENTQKRINRIADMTAEAQAAKEVGLDYAKIQQLEAMREAARNEGGGAGMGMGLGAGISFGQNIAQAMNAPSPAPTPAAANPMEKLAQLKQMLDAGLITEQEFADKKKAILDAL